MPHFSYDFDNYTHHIARQIYILARPTMHLGRTVSVLGKYKSDLEAPKSDIGRHKSAPPHPGGDTTGGKDKSRCEKVGSDRSHFNEKRYLCTYKILKEQNYAT